MKDAQMESILTLAYDRSADAGFAHPFCLEDNGDCGCAMVIIAGRHRRLIQAVRDLGVSNVEKHTYGGYAVSIFSGWQGQSRAVYEAAANAFVSVLKDAGFEAHTHSYAD
ncbi:hypothetical protein [Niveispirillum sp.]|uniref:hypothetical protein n=1 Tax=Niveispirillum sp. TaxID=1917217 RepID=UPI001B78DED8|nr:hypothetical protein [Niveispirillum sp.]MBP7339273.1 hypothetical protein [Niveispirillum sp.]